MNIIPKKEGNREILMVSGNATVAHAAALKAVLLDGLEKTGNVELVFRDVSDADVTVLQLLCSAHRFAADRQKTLNVKGLDQDPLHRLLHQTGFTRHIGCRDTTRETCFWMCKHNE